MVRWTRFVSSPWRLWWRLLVQSLAGVAIFAWLAGCSGVAQQGDFTFAWPVERAVYAEGAGPRVAIDEAHCNLHTADGRYRPFAELLRRDGFRVDAHAGGFSEESLEGVDVMVIANALAEDNCKSWKHSNASAFQTAEMDALEAWVERGGALWLIADHMPFPAAAERLALRFGVAFMNGYVRPRKDGPWIVFERSSGHLADHPITAGRFESEAVTAVVSFTGQGFRAVSPEVVPIMTLPANTRMNLPLKHAQPALETPNFSAEGLLQGAVVSFGAGRVAIFGEAAMFSAQEFERDGATHRFGMNSDDARDNPQFLLNVMRWLVGTLGAEERDEGELTR